MIKNIPLLISAIISGLILFQSTLVAPAVNKLINSKEASVFLRYIWPKFFLIIALLSLFSFLVIIYQNNNQNLAKYFTLSSFVLMTICYAITPLINNAKDTSNEQLWVVLHLATILITLIVLVLSVLTIIYWKFNP
jgi:hypothetical protein|tara:strand:+ start:670 stop:1077 length:408 start_codon:yes stop_codon:yes gene_type:complete